MKSKHYLALVLSMAVFSLSPASRAQESGNFKSNSSWSTIRLKEGISTVTVDTSGTKYKQDGWDTESSGSSGGYFPCGSGACGYYPGGVYVPGPDGNPGGILVPGQGSRTELVPHWVRVYDYVNHVTAEVVLHDRLSKEIGFGIGSDDGTVRLRAENWVRPEKFAFFEILGESSRKRANGDLEYEHRIRIHVLDSGGGVFGTLQKEIRNLKMSDKEISFFVQEMPDLKYFRLNLSMTKRIFFYDSPVLDRYLDESAISLERADGGTVVHIPLSSKMKEELDSKSLFSVTVKFQLIRPLKDMLPGKPVERYELPKNDSISATIEVDKTESSHWND